MKMRPSDVSRKTKTPNWIILGAILRRKTLLLKFISVKIIKINLWKRHPMEGCRGAAGRVKWNLVRGSFSKQQLASFTGGPS